LISTPRLYLSSKLQVEEAPFKADTADKGIPRNRWKMEKWRIGWGWIEPAGWARRNIGVKAKLAEVFLQV
jgi:hypothetical protein